MSEVIRAAHDEYVGAITYEPDPFDALLARARQFAQADRELAWLSLKTHRFRH